MTAVAETIVYGDTGDEAMMWAEQQFGHYALLGVEEPTNAVDAFGHVNTDQVDLAHHRGAAILFED